MASMRREVARLLKQADRDLENARKTLGTELGDGLGVPSDLRGIWPT